jgi:hypothetical protein
MAQATDDDTLEWLLITSAIASVARRMKAAPDAAQHFLLTELHWKRIRYRYHGMLEFDGWVFPEPYFFRRTKHVRYEITTDGAVVRTGPAVVEAQPDESGQVKVKREPGEVLYIFDVTRMVVARMPLVQLHSADIDRRLCETGYASPADSSAQQELPLPAPAAKQCEPSGWQAKRTIAAVRRLYPPFGQTPSGKSYKMLQREIAEEPGIVADNEKHTWPSPGIEVVTDVVKYLGRSDD